MEVTERIKELIDGYLQDNSIELIDMIYRREQGGMVLRLLVDTPAGVTIKECEDLSHYISDSLDTNDVMQEHYLLEVSSPGIDRPIKTDRDFERAMGKVLEVTMYMPVDGKKSHDGTLIGMDAEKIVLEAAGVSTVIPRSSIARARRKVEL